MSIMSEIRALECEISECEEAISELEREEEIIRNLQIEITSEVEEPVNSYDMTAGDEFRGVIEENAEKMQYQIYTETHLAQESTSKLLSEIALAKERLREHIEECRSRIELLEAELETQSLDRAV